MSKVYLLEDQRGGEYKAYQNFEDALRFVMKEIENDTTQDYEDKFDCLKELLNSMIVRDEQKWGKGFAIDELYYCWEIEFVIEPDKLI